MNRTKAAICFGTYRQSATCNTCGLRSRCKAVEATDGLDLVAALISHLEETLPEGTYTDTDRVTELVDQLLHPHGVELSETEKELLQILSQDLAGSPVDLQDL